MRLLAGSIWLHASSKMGGTCACAPMPVSARLKLVIHPFMVVPFNDSSRARTAGQMLYSQMLPIVTYALLRVGDDVWPLRQTQSFWGAPGKKFTPVRLTSSP